MAVGVGVGGFGVDVEVSVGVRVGIGVDVSRTWVGPVEGCGGATAGTEVAGWVGTEAGVSVALGDGVGNAVAWPPVGVIVATGGEVMAAGGVGGSPPAISDGASRTAMKAVSMSTISPSPTARTRAFDLPLAVLGVSEAARLLLVVTKP